MKITSVKGYPVWVGHRDCFIVKVETDAGIAGIGEGGISVRELAMQGMTEHFAKILVGRDPRQIEHLWQTLYRGHYFEGGKIAGAVVSAIDIALWTFSVSRSACQSTNCSAGRAAPRSAVSPPPAH